MKTRRICRRLLVAVAVAFLLSAWMYWLATIRVARSAQESNAGAPESGLVEFFRDHGAKVLAIELAALAACAAALIFVERELGPERLSEDEQQRQSTSQYDDNRNNEDRQES